MKSPVFGGGKNRKHRPTRKAVNHSCAGRVNMRGKKSKAMNCGCCVCLDLREKAMARDLKRSAKETT